MFTSRGDRSFRCSRACLLFFASCSFFLDSRGSADDATKVSGRELFLREWIPNDARSYGGDGLGPQFNESSCVGCHNQGGPGGAGPSAKNVQLVSVFRSERKPHHLKSKRASSSIHDNSRGSKQIPKPAVPGPGPGNSPTVVDDLFSEPTDDPFIENPKPTPLQPSAATRSAEVQREREQLAKIHPGLRNANSVVLHRFSTASGYSPFRNEFISGMMGNIQGMPGMSGSFVHAPGPKALFEAQSETTLRRQTIHIEDFAFIVSERNTSALFGSGQIDALPDAVLIAAAQRKFDEYPDVSGRVGKLKDGRLGRFGWKAQKATLRDFVLTACAVELGLHVPGETQAGMPQNPEYESPGLDLNKQQSDAMVTFVANLAAPQVRITAHQSELDYLKRGRERFDSVGCGVCHTPHLGAISNIYSDLLLHDMGQELSDSGSYGGLAPNSTEDDEASRPVPDLVSARPELKVIDETTLIGTTRREWRTPPLWGVRDSAPYLHDGRAVTLEQAIALHGGEGSSSARKFFELSEPERLQVTLFLRALIAPQN